MPASVLGEEKEGILLSVALRQLPEEEINDKIWPYRL